MQQLFDLTRGEKLKREGMNKAADSRERQLAYARHVAEQIALSREDRTCDADLVQKVLIPDNIALGNSAGSLFRNKKWKWTGKFKKSERPMNHARLIRVWKLD